MVQRNKGGNTYPVLEKRNIFKDGTSFEVDIFLETEYIMVVMIERIFNKKFTFERENINFKYVNKFIQNKDNLSFNKRYQ